MPWPTITLRQRREEVRDDVAATLPGADATVPNAPLTAVGEAQAALTKSNDDHLDWVARMMMPDTAEGEFADRWGNIWLPEGRKGASFAAGSVTVSGQAGAVLPSGTELEAPAYDADGNQVTLRFEVALGVTLAGPSAVVDVAALTPGALANLAAGAVLALVDQPAGIDGSAIVAAPGFAGGADQEPDAELIERYIARIQEPPHGGALHDYVAWMREVPGVTRAWAAGNEMGIGTVTCRFVMDAVRAAAGGIPTSEDIAAVAAHLETVRPVALADCFVVEPIRQDETVTIDLLSLDTPEVRAAIAAEVAAMLAARARPGQTIYASWVREAISPATGEDYHDVVVANLVPDTAGHMIFITVEYS